MANLPTSDPVQLPWRELVQLQESCHPRGSLRSKRPSRAPKRKTSRLLKKEGSVVESRSRRSRYSSKRSRFSAHKESQIDSTQGSRIGTRGS